MVVGPLLSQYNQLYSGYQDNVFLNVSGSVSVIVCLLGQNIKFLVLKHNISRMLKKVLLTVVRWTLNKTLKAENDKPNLIFIKNIST